MTSSNCKLFLGLELTSYIQAADDSKRTDSPAEHSALSEIVSLVLFRRQKPKFFWTANWPPLKVFVGALGLVFVSTGHKARLGHVLAFFVLFDLLRFSWNWFSLRWQSTKRNAVPVQTGLSSFDLSPKRTKSSQSTCIQDDLRSRSFTVARV